jgi:hypothetical protein
MNFQRKRFNNDFSDAATFIDLGTADYGDWTNGKCKNVYRDLYAITHLEGERNRQYIDFGCKWSDEPGDYSSGSADKCNGYDEWVIIGSDDIALAAARYFANHHYKEAS